MFAIHFCLGLAHNKYEAINAFRGRFVYQLKLYLAKLWYFLHRYTATRQRGTVREKPICSIRYGPYSIKRIVKYSGGNKSEC